MKAAADLIESLGANISLLLVVIGDVLHATEKLNYPFRSLIKEI